MARQELNAREQEMYASYKTDQDAISARRDRMWAEIEKKQQELSADKVILQECEEKYAKDMHDLDPDNLLLQEQLEKDRVAIDYERNRITEDEANLYELKKEVEHDFEQSNQGLRMKRDEQIESLRDSKDELKALEKRRLDFIDTELDKRSVLYSEKSSWIEEEEDKLHAMQSQQKSVAEILAQIQQTTEAHRQQLEDSALEQQAQLETDIAELQVRKRQADKDARKVMEKFSNRKRRYFLP